MSWQSDLRLVQAPRLLELYVTKTQSSAVVPKVAVDEVQNLYREDLSEVTKS
jgi:hypothetical protein